MLHTLAAVIFAMLSILVGLFQVALALGAPWGDLTLGGRYRGALPRRIRVVPVISIGLMTGFAAVVLSRAGTVLPNIAGLSIKLIWVVVAYCALGVLMNTITPSKRERKFWLPVVTVMLVCSLFVAVRAPLA